MRVGAGVGRAGVRREGENQEKTYCYKNTMYQF